MEHTLPDPTENVPPQYSEGYRLRDAFKTWIAATEYPCVGAKAALAKSQITYLIARDFTSAWDDLRLHDALSKFADRFARKPRLFTSLVVLFRGPTHLTETQFERCLWERLQSLHDKDVWLGFRYDQRVAPDPAAPNFSFSLGGQAFFVIGLHPSASRPARRFSHPALVFNLHEQFEMLRRERRFETIRDTVQSRDRKYSGSINPMAVDHGRTSEARQYSGRLVGSDWRCPFRPDRRVIKNAPRNSST